MFRVVKLVALLIAAGLYGSQGANHAKAAEKDEKHASVVTAVIHRDGKKIDQDFDLTKPHDREQLLEHLHNNHVEKLEQKHDLDLMTIKADLAIWSIAVFLLLFFVLSKFAWGPMLEGLHKREHNILSALDDAQKARAEAQTLREQLQVEMNKASEKVREMLDEARRDAQLATESMIDKARAEIQSERDRLRKEIQTATDQAIQELWKQTAQLATLVSSKVIRRQLSVEDHRHLVDEALTELGERGPEWKRQVASTHA